MGVRYNRHLGSVESMLPKQWTLETASGQPAICCECCEQIQEIAPPTYKIYGDGKVTPIFTCENCSSWSWINLESYGEDDLTRN